MVFFGIFFITQCKKKAVTKIKTFICTLFFFEGTTNSFLSNENQPLSFLLSLNAHFKVFKIFCITFHNKVGKSFILHNKIYLTFIIRKIIWTFLYLVLFCTQMI